MKPNEYTPIKIEDFLLNDIVNLDIYNLVKSKINKLEAGR